MTDQVYTTYIKTTPQKVWDAITNPEFARQYWVHENVSDWKKGSKWQHVTPDKSVKLVGEVLESNPPKKLVMTWADPKNLDDDTRVTFDINAIGDLVKLVVTHGNFKQGSIMETRVCQGWPLVLSSMKSFLETGKAIDIMSVKLGCSDAA